MEDGQGAGRTDGYPMMIMNKCILLCNKGKPDFGFVLIHILAERRKNIERELHFKNLYVIVDIEQLKDERIEGREAL